MSSGTFGYPLGFATLFAVIGLMVSSRTDEGEQRLVVERADYTEIHVLYQNRDVRVQEKCERFMRLYPHSKESEAVSVMMGEMLVQEQQWKEVLPFCRGLETRFPKSANIDRFVFFQAIALFQVANFKEAIPQFDKLLKDHPNSTLVEMASYYQAMARFLSNDYKASLKACNDYLAKFPNGRFAGDMRYRLAFIDFSDKDVDQSDKIIRELGGFLAEHPDDPVKGSMYCLLADTYKKKGDLEQALECYKKAVWTESPDDVIQYALESATSIMQGNKDWEGIAKLHGEFMSKKPESQLALQSATWVAKMYTRMGKNTEAFEIFAKSLKPRIGDPADEQAEVLIDELVKSLVPRKKRSEIDADALDKQLTDILGKVVQGRENATTAARIFYARARMAQLLKRADRSELFLKGIALTAAKDPSSLGPALLTVCGGILLKSGDLAGAEAMFQRLKDHFAAGFGNSGAVGLGKVALVRNKPEEALGIFADVLENHPAPADLQEATIGKVQALAETNQLDEALKQGLAALALRNKLLKGESAARIYLILGEIYEKKAAAVAGDEAKQFLKQAHGAYQRVYTAFRAYPEIYAEGYFQAAEVLMKLGEREKAQDILKALAEDPDLQHTEAAKKAKALLEAEGK